MFSLSLCFFFYLSVFFVLYFLCFFFFFFFQAEDGIRDWSVTGVQTCALPILHTRRDASDMVRPSRFTRLSPTGQTTHGVVVSEISGSITSTYTKTGRRKIRSEERRVGKECRARWSK